MNSITPIVVGILIGWAASLLKDTAGREDLIRNVVVGIAGAFMGGWLLGMLFESSQGGFSFGAMFVSFIGAATFLFVAARFSPE